MLRLSRLRIRALEFAVIAAIAIIAGSLLFQWPHWTEYVAHSCDACGNRRAIIRQFRWYRQTAETERWDTRLPVPPGHVHDWWQFGAGKISPTEKFALSSGGRYRDGSLTWSPRRPSADE
ncbi:MAG: hypothetical protein WD069_08470 [Planctomycetales bacterium]